MRHIDKNIEEDRKEGNMKKYLCAYAILFMILLLILITGGIPWGTIIDAQNSLGTADGFKVETVFLMYNFITILLCLITSIVITCVKANQIRYKWIISVILLAFSATLLPIVRTSSMGGFTGASNIAYQSFVTSFFEGKR